MSDALRLAQQLEADYYDVRVIAAADQIRALHWKCDEHVACLERKDREIAALREAAQAVVREWGAENKMPELCTAMIRLRAALEAK